MDKPVGFKPALVERLLRSAWKRLAETEDADGSDDSADDDDAALADGLKVKIQPDTLPVAAEFLRLFVLQALERAQEEAMIDGSPEVEPRHVEQILALLLLDF
ncbi:hypothetical protein SPRG_08618 [Saprolegnia parasitica CBS 223.65]|uniref:Centromere protein X n=1 Tax=Saprolegnia parasitica (strain CBS 223.65) TaxID=695850 RepID=A0A067C9W0_SAPPC|nr:hypothetical protein SPRG_08618 [Saprolegnia parasitica CBS 223.65]KDO25965.1 hypothetical protein SPRG_08618 [Saprolegnia parasitica CBS 223.65]|eukprot:XP_012203252.1 hypothetical protein SPRG_08618 [Saprolegnia parasitica CBS 223.65]